MSTLQKAIARIQRREGPRIGFGPVSREQPRAMLAGGFAADEASARALTEAGADVVVLRTPVPEAIDILQSLGAGSAAVGVQVDALDAAAAAALRAAKCDFVISGLDGTSAAAVDNDEMGHVIAIDPNVTDTILRALGPLGFDALLAMPVTAEMSLAAQLELVRLASFASTPLLLQGRSGMSVAELRVLRDSGAAAVLLPAGTGAGELEGLIANLKSVPAPRKHRRESGDVALVPAARASGGDGEEDDDGDD